MPDETTILNFRHLLYWDDQRPPLAGIVAAESCIIEAPVHRGLGRCIRWMAPSRGSVHSEHHGGYHEFDRGATGCCTSGVPLGSWASSSRSMTAGPEGVVRFYNGRGTAEQWIKEGKYALNWTRSCRAIGSWPTGCVCLCSSWRTTLGTSFAGCVLPKAVKHWSLRSVQVKLIKMGGRLVRHSRRLIFQLSEVSAPRQLFQGVLDRIGRLSPGAKLREGTTTILPRGGERSRESPCLQMRFHPTGRGHEDDEDGQEVRAECSTTANASLIG